MGEAQHTSQYVSAQRPQRQRVPVFSAGGRKNRKHGSASIVVPAGSCRYSPEPSNAGSRPETPFFNSLLKFSRNCSYLMLNSQRMTLVVAGTYVTISTTKNVTVIMGIRCLVMAPIPALARLAATNNVPPTGGV